MNTLGAVCLVVLLISGSALFMGYVGWIDINPYAAHAAASGWFATVTAIILYVIATIKYLMGRFDGYWNSLFPLTFGVSLLGMFYILYVPETSIKLVFLAIILAGVAGIVLVMSHLLYVKWLPVIVVIPLFIPSYSPWAALIVGVLLITAGVFSQILTQSGRVGTPSVPTRNE